MLLFANNCFLFFHNSQLNIFHLQVITLLKVFDEWCNIICIFDLHYTGQHEKLPDQQDNLLAPNNWMGPLLSPETKKINKLCLQSFVLFFLYRESSSESILIIQDLSQGPTLNLVSLNKLVDGISWNYSPVSYRFFLFQYPRSQGPQFFSQTTFLAPDPQLQPFLNISQWF